jgi:hypothetical protein
MFSSENPQKMSSTYPRKQASGALCAQAKDKVSDLMEYSLLVEKENNINFRSDVCYEKE